MKITDIPMEELSDILQLQMSTGGVARLVVTGDSMYPTFRHKKDVVLLSKICRPLKKKDLILYKRESGQYILHRIVSKPKQDHFICCGDNQWEKEPVAATQVIAIVDSYIRNGKTYSIKYLPYRLWVSFWVATFPVRRPLIALRRWLGRIRRKF